jgi:hypothetical protein
MRAVYCVLPYFYVINLALPLVLGVSAIRATCQLGTQCSGEAKVSLERNGPNGSFAWDRPDSSDSKLVVTFKLHGTCWATGSIYLTGGEGRPAEVASGPKKLMLSGGD